MLKLNLTVRDPRSPGIGSLIYIFVRLRSFKTLFGLGYIIVISCQIKDSLYLGWFLHSQF